MTLHPLQKGAKLTGPEGGGSVRVGSRAKLEPGADIARVRHSSTPTMTLDAFTTA